MEQILNAGDRRFIVKDTIRFYTDAQRDALAKIFKDDGIIYLQRPNDNNFYIVDEIPAVEFTEILKEVTIPAEEIASEPEIEPVAEPIQEQSHRPDITKTT